MPKRVDVSRHAFETIRGEYPGNGKRLATAEKGLAMLDRIAPAAGE